MTLVDTDWKATNDASGHRRSLPFSYPDGIITVNRSEWKCLAALIQPGARPQRGAGAKVQRA
jgi:hypothetical protein